VTVTGCTILNSENYAIYAWGSGSEYVFIEDNTILNATYGFYSYRASDGLVTNNEIMYCSSAGIMLDGSDGNNYNVTLNTVENNYDGIVVSTSDFHFIMNNTVRWNSNYGLYLFASSSTEVYYNTFALNGNYEDSFGGNFWDDGVSLGNSWDDWDGIGTYDVDGDTTDRYPALYLPSIPIINQPQDLAYAEGSTGNTVTWLPFDDALSHWELEIDGALFASDTWDFVDITVDVDGLAYGTHTAVITVWDVDQNSVTDTVVITVFDDTPPTISSESDVIVFADASGQVVEWTASDLHPDTLEFLIDDVVVDTGTWETGIIQESLDGLSVGDHIAQIIVYDVDGNSATDIIVVRVVDDDTPPTINSPADLTYTEGFTQNFIVWSGSDEYPDSYRVVFNGSTYETGAWTGAAITVNVDGLSAGNHTFTVTVYDGAGLSASDSVTVIVVPPEGFTTPPPPADLTLLIILGAGAAVVVVIVIIYMLKQKGGYKP
jgi:parallel beta-helix repeat protein